MELTSQKHPTSAFELKGQLVVEWARGTAVVELGLRVPEGDVVRVLEGEHEALNVRLAVAEGLGEGDGVALGVGEGLAVSAGLWLGLGERLAPGPAWSPALMPPIDGWHAVDSQAARLKGRRLPGWSRVHFIMHCCGEAHSVKAGLGLHIDNKNTYARVSHTPAALPGSSGAGPTDR